ncbi:MAG TPA: OsmC family protein [Thermoanaerobaculia bacterium]|nr:OsmC family protein [Thermoanaerobaculia bacterium]
MTGTFGGALEARHIDASNRRLTSDIRGEIELEDHVLVIRRIHATYHLSAPAADRATAERVHAMHAERCPIYRSLYRAIAITTELRFEPIE